MTQEEMQKIAVLYQRLVLYLNALPCNLSVAVELEKSINDAVGSKLLTGAQQAQDSRELANNTLKLISATMVARNALPESERGPAKEALRQLKEQLGSLAEVIFPEEA